MVLIHIRDRGGGCHRCMCTPLWALGGPQTPHPIILHPPFLIPGYGPVTRDTCTFREDYITYTCTTNIVRIHVLVLSLHIIWHDLLFVNHGDIINSS